MLEGDGVFDAAVTGSRVVTLSGHQLAAYALPSLHPVYAHEPLAGVFAGIWQAPEGGRLYSLETLSVSGTGTSTGADALTVQAFDLGSGKVARTTTVGVRKAVDGPDGPASGRIVGVQGRYVVLETWIGDGTHRAVVLDARRNALAWQRSATVLAVDRGRVVLGTGNIDRPGRVEARGVADGRLQWKALAGTRSVVPIGEGSGVLRLFRAGPDGPTTDAVRLATGATGASQPASSTRWSCQSGFDIALCSSTTAARRVVAFDLRDGHRLWQLPARGRSAPAVTLVQGAHAYGVLNAGKGVVLDIRTGREESADSGAAPSVVGAWGGAVLFGGKAFFVPAGTVPASPGS